MCVCVWGGGGVKPQEHRLVRPTAYCHCGYSPDYTPNYTYHREACACGIGQEACGHAVWVIPEDD